MTLPSTLCVSCGHTTRDYVMCGQRFPMCRECVIRARQNAPPVLDEDEEEF
jgi:hypothetical protein